MDAKLLSTLDDADAHASLQHVLAAEAHQSMYPPLSIPDSNIAPELGGTPVPPQPTELESPKPEASRVGKAPSSVKRGNKDGNVISAFSGNRMRFLKKEDGEPLWRTDIQFQFLKYVFEDENKVFTKFSDGTSGHTFADIYIDTMAKSSKTSQILKDKLLSDRPGAIDMAMICLLVNVGRMNTTLNFFPEMRARVRTYHPIPALQAKQTSQAYKQLQDGPRLKSILKGAQEVKENEHMPSTLEELFRTPKPRTNPVNLIFVLAQYAPKVSETHFLPNQDFFDIIIRTTLSSRSRATAFLWLLWWYLESDFSAEAAMNNPFGPGQPGEDPNMPIKVPTLVVLTEEEALRENQDTEEEVAFGEAKKVEREAILSNDMPPTAAAPKRGAKTPLMEHQHNYRFRVSPYGSSMSGSDAGSRGRPSQSPPPEGEAGRAGRVDRDATRSPSPSARVAHHNASSPNPTPPGSSHKHRNGTSRSSRKTRDQPIQSMDYYQRHPELQHGLPTQLLSQQSSSEAPYRPRVFRSPNDPDLGAPMNIHGDLNNILQVTGGNWMSLNGADDPRPSPGAERSNPKKSRLPSQHQQALERSRRERVMYVLDRSMRTTAKSAMRERHRRGILTDAWVKCHALPPDYDSEEDKYGRPGGIEEIADGTGMDEDELAKMAFVGDIGAQDALYAQTFRRLGRTMGITSDTRRAHRMAARQAQEEAIVVDENNREVIVIDDNDGTATPVPAGTQAKRKRAPAKRKSRAAIVAEGDAATPRSSPGGRSAAGTGRRRTAKKPGGDGVPLAEWKEGTPSAGRATASGRGVKRAPAELDDMDAELLGDAAGGTPLPDDGEDDMDAELLDDASNADVAHTGGAVPEEEEAAELLMGMNDTMAGSGKEHGASLMEEAEKMISNKQEGQGEVDMADA